MKMILNKKILLAGHYGFGNTGDEAILSSILSDFRKQQNGIEFIVASANPKSTALRHQVQSIHWQDVNNLLDAAKHSDLIMIGGGGVFVDYWGVPSNTQLTQYHWGIAYYNAIGLLSVLFDKPFVIHSVGVGPLLTEEGRHLTRQTFEIADKATVRDEVSANLLKSITVSPKKIRITTDPALFLEPQHNTALKTLQSAGINPKDKPILGVCIRNWEGGNWKRELAKALDRFLETHPAQTIFLPFQINENPLENDLRASLEIYSLLRDKKNVYVLSNIYSPETMKALLSYCQSVIGMRLHSLIFAVGGGVPVVALAYDPKVAGFMSSLGISVSTIDLQKVTSENLFQMINLIWAKPELVQKKISRQMIAMEKELQTDTRLIMDLLNDKTHRTSQVIEIDFLREFALQQTISLAKTEKRLQLTFLEKVKRIVNAKPFYFLNRLRKAREFFLPLAEDSRDS